MTARPENLKTKIKEAFNAFNPSNMGVLDSFYADNVQFVDPVVKLDGLFKLKKYYSHVYKNVISIQFDFHKIENEGESYFAEWTMNLAVRGLNGGKAYSVEGLSALRFDPQGKVSYHRDYVDLGAMVYEKLPVLGPAIRLIKKQLG
jgi:hypothetical protein